MSDVVDPDDELMSLREAIELANANPGADEVSFDEGLSGTILLGGTELQIVDSISIMGPGSNVITIDADHQSRIFSLKEDSQKAPLQILISGLSLDSGQAPEGGNGGAIYSRSAERLEITASEIRNSSADQAGGAIHAGSTILSVMNSRFSNNQADNGGAISSNSIVDLNGALIENNTAVSRGGAIDGSGGAELTLRETKLFNNTVTWQGGGGAVYLFGGSLQAIDSRFISNSTMGVGADGGAIYAISAELLIDRSEISHNEVTGFGGDGGGISAEFSEVVVVNSSIHDNVTSDTQVGGGGVYAERSTLMIGNTTIANNELFAPNRSSNAGGAGISGQGTDLTIWNSTITGNRSSNVVGGVYLRTLSSQNDLWPTRLAVHNSIIIANLDDSTAPDIWFPEVEAQDVDIRHSFIGSTAGNPSTRFCCGNNRTNIQWSEILIGNRNGPLLANNGGPTKTVALAPRSGAIDFGDDELFLGFSSTVSDQRGVGFDRFGDGNGDGFAIIDAGAVEASREGFALLEASIEPSFQLVTDPNIDTTASFSINAATEMVFNI
ncbi:MAG: choice-of-anchor Q domain-containing protein, partial [Planctomycetota bacterium]